MITPLDIDAISFVGVGLNRPECVLCTAHGDIFTSDWRGGVAHILPNGEQRLYQGKTPDGRALRPNGIALNADGSFLVADLGEEKGGVFRLQRNGDVKVFVDRVDGLELPPSNFVFTDCAHRTWITVSTRKIPRAAAYRADIADGFIILVDNKGARIVADGLYYTNEAAIHPDGQSLYVNETFGRRLVRYRLKANGELGPQEVVSEFGEGTYPDGLTFDAQGCAWITSIISNRVIRVFPDGRQQLMLSDSNAEHIAWTEEAFQRNELGRPHLDNIRSKRLRNISSLAFGGKNLQRLHLGCLQGESIACICQEIIGHPPTHWKYH